MNDMSYCLYLLIRTDMDSMGAGRAIAQGAHAANQFINDHLINHLMNHCTGNETGSFAPNKNILSWMKEANGFGTTISLSVNIQELNDIIDRIDSSRKRMVNDILYGVTKDPIYTLKDGDTIHIIENVTTCGYVFGRKKDLEEFLGTLPLVGNWCFTN